MTTPGALHSVGDRLAGRYRVEAILGRGGMAVVYRVHDERSGRAFALKRAWAQDNRQAQRRATLLEREYHTLTQLAHPRIIEIYEFGLVEGEPYYTMELLSGNDLDQTGRMEWPAACALLRDVASSLAILHARGLIHRDVSLRNVRRTSEGRVKLIDFGAMMPMGVAKEIVGTAPFIAPELIQMQELDARCDLFALGALGYYLLTGRHAFPALRMTELRDLWRSRPTPPVRLVPEIPAGLSALIVQLLALDRSARPNSAAEVMERLCVIAGLPLEERIEVSHAYLSMPALVGREQALVEARREILGLARRDGGVLLIEGPAGSGRSRMLDACVLEGKLLGATVLRADAGDAAQGSWGVARTLCAQLCAHLPQEAQAAARLSRDVLSHVIDGLQMGDTTVSSVTPERSQLLRALRDFVLSLSRSQRLLIAVDDMDEIDEPSAAFLAALGHKSERSAVLLALSMERRSEPTGSSSLRLLRMIAKTVTLEALDAAQTESLLRSIFGDVPHLQLVAARIHGLALGNPRDTLDLARHLVARELARYQAGSWLLPAALDEGDLPRTLADGLRSRLQALSADARALLEVQVVAEGESFSVAEFAELAQLDEHRRVFTAFDELVAARVFAADGAGYRFAQRGFGPSVSANLPAVRRRELHARIADLGARTRRSVLERSDHLLNAGQLSEGVKLLCSVDLQLQLPSVPLLERAIEAAEHEDFPPRVLHQLRAALLGKASLVLAADSFRRCLPLVLARLELDSGLVTYRELSELPPAERLQQALGRTQERYLATPATERVLAPVDAIRELARVSGAACSFAMQLYDLELLAALPSLAPFEALSPALSIVSEVISSCDHWIRGRQAKFEANSRRMLERIALPDRAGLDEVQCRRTRLGLIYSVGLFTSTLGLGSTEDLAAVLESAREHRVNAWRLRMVMHLAQGNTNAARKCQRRAELLQLQDSADQNYLGMSAASEVICHADAGDMLGVKNCVETLAMLAERYPRWRAMHCYGVSRYRWLQGDLPSALEAAVGGLAHAPATEHNAFVWLAGLEVRLLVELARTDEAITRGRAHLELAEREELTFYDNSIYIGLSEALAMQAEFNEALQVLDGFTALSERLGRSGLALGALYEARARIAIRMRDTKAVDHYTNLCGQAYKIAENPVLGARLLRLIEDAHQAQVTTIAPAAEQQELMQLKAAETEYDSVHGRMLECIDKSDRARCALTLLLQSTDSASGYLYGLYEEGEPRLIAALPDGGVDAELSLWVKEQALRTLGRLDIATLDVEQELQSGPASHYTDSDGRRVEPVFLLAPQTGGARVAAVLALHLAPLQGTLPPRRLLEEVARELLDYGDVIGLQLDEGTTQSTASNPARAP